MEADAEDRGTAVKRILFFIRGGEIGGAELSLIEIIQRLDKKKFQPMLISLTAGPAVDEIAKIGVETSILGAPGDLVDARREELASPRNLAGSARRTAEAWRLAGRLAERLREIRPDALYCNSLKSHAIGAAAGWRARVPVVWHVRDVLFHRWERWLFGAMRLMFMPTVIANSRYTAAGLGGDSLIIYNGVDLEALTPSRPPEAVKKELGIPPDAPVVGMAGRIQRWKGQEVFLQAAELLLKDFPEARFVVAGGEFYSGEGLLDELKKTVSGSDALRERVVFTGHRGDVTDVMNAYDIYVHPTLKDEPFGRVVIEAMALSKPVVCTRCGGPEEIVEDETTGLLVPPGDAAALARAAGRLLIDGGGARRFGENGRRRVEELFRLEATVRAVETVIEEALS